MEAPKELPAVPIQLWEPEAPKTLRMLVYGDSGVGKTVFASTAPKPLFLDVDKGMLSVERRVGRWEINGWRDVQEAFKFLAGSMEAKNYETVVIDSLSEIQKMNLQYVVTTFPEIKRGYIDLPSQSDWGKSLNDFDKLLRAFRTLKQHLICTAPATRRVFETDPVEPSLAGKATASNVCRAMDVVGYMYVSTDEEGKNRHYMAFDLSSHVTKGRLKGLPPKLTNPTWDDIAPYLRKA